MMLGGGGGGGELLNLCHFRRNHIKNELTPVLKGK